MTPQFKYTKAVQEDIQRLGYILEQCFVMSAGESKSYIERIGLENFRVIYREKDVAGGLGIIPMNQWWGGQLVPIGGIAAVGIAPEYRGDGVAIALIENTLKELLIREVPISVLYPATQRLYRKAGYEQAGVSAVWEVSAESIQIQQSSLPVQPVEAANYHIFYDLYQQQAKLTHGYLDRHEAIWQGLIRTTDKETLYGYLIGEKEHPEGYLFFTQHRTKDDTILKIRDWVVLTNQALRSFWTFINNHRSQIDKVTWKSPSLDHLSLMLPEQSATMKNCDRWFLRIVDVCKALEARGYPPQVQAELHLQVQDELLTSNNGKFILSVANGRGEVTKGGKGELQLNIRGLAPLYSGLFNPRQLQLTGQLQATETALSAATQIFASTTPWMADFF